MPLGKWRAQDQRRAACRRCQGREKIEPHENKEPGHLEVTQVKGAGRKGEGGVQAPTFNLTSVRAKLPNSQMSWGFLNPTDKLQTLGHILHCSQHIIWVYTEQHFLLRILTLSAKLASANILSVLKPRNMTIFYLLVFTIISKTFVSWLRTHSFPKCYTFLL